MSLTLFYGAECPLRNPVVELLTSVIGDRNRAFYYARSWQPEAGAPGKRIYGELPSSDTEVEQVNFTPLWLNGMTK
jgi:hypothetical protein